jgi:hypothetical protein
VVQRVYNLGSISFQPVLHTKLKQLIAKYRSHGLAVFPLALHDEKEGNGSYNNGNSDMEVDYTVHLENIYLMSRGILNSCT